jgi:2,3-diaminopropionate biosynthesis protein SbnA
MILKSADEMVMDDVFVNLSRFADDLDVVLKIEGFNAAGSIKLKTALGLVHHAETHSDLRPGGHIIESSSGNLGVALSLISAVRGYEFTCVTDPNASSAHISTMRSFGTNIVIITERDENGGGYLARRLGYIRQRLRREPRLVWPNQYANFANRNIHYERTAAAILREFAHVDYLFVGAGTTGTLMGCAIVAVDVHGSVTLGGPPGPRHIPGLGASRRPELFQPEGIDEFIIVNELESIAACRQLAARHGLLVGGSTGSVLAAVRQLAPRIPPASVVVAISPDNGERYLDMIYSDDWVSRTYGQGAVERVRAATSDSGHRLLSLDPPADSGSSFRLDSCTRSFAR